MLKLVLAFLLVFQRPAVSTVVLESRIFDLVNIEREQHKLKSLKASPKLVELARNHSRDMAMRGFFDHTNPDGLSPSDRGRIGGFPCRRQISLELYTVGLAENIFQNNLYDRVVFHNDIPTYEWKSTERIAVSTVQGWMNSPEIGRAHV